MADDQGATPRELLLEAARRNNVSLLEEVLSDLRAHTPTAGTTAEAHIAATLNAAADGLGNGVLHLAAQHGSYDVLDLLLDQEGLEIELANRLEGDTPLHAAVRFVNGSVARSEGEAEREAALAVVEILLDAGCDPRIRNKAKLKPIELADPSNKPLRDMLQKAEYAFLAGGDVVAEDDDDGAGSGSGSDSE